MSTLNRTRRIGTVTVMARTTVITLIDDIDGTEAHQTVTFGLDGQEYEIDLSTPNATRLRADLEAWVRSGRRTGGRRKRGTGTL